MFYNDGNISLTINSKHFDFIGWFDLNSNFNSLFEVLSIKEFLVDSIMWLYILPISTKISKSFLS